MSNSKKKAIIGHLDMDAFFASIEERERPYLKGKAIVVGADPQNGKGRGVVSTANYKARKYGIQSAMPISQAWKISKELQKKGKPGVIFLSPDFEKYEKTSKKIFQILRKFSPLIENASIDEFYFDLTFAKGFLKARKICQRIKEEIKRKEKLSSSIGIGPNKLIAKIASGIKKPDGLTVVTPNEVQAFLEPLSIREIPGIGPKIENFFYQKGVKRIKDLKRFSKVKLRKMLGKRGEDLYFKARGKDNMFLVKRKELKSIGKQITFLKDTTNTPLIIQEFGKLCDEVFFLFKKSRSQAFRRVSVTVRFADFVTKTHSKTLKERILDKKKLEIRALNLLLPFLDKRKNPKKRPIRLVGLRIEK